MYQNCTILGDKGYLSIDYQRDLFTYNQINIEVPMRKNQHRYKLQPYIFRKSRKHIETLFSQLCDQLYDLEETMQNYLIDSRTRYCQDNSADYYTMD
ncbi:hypothetical protein KCF3NO3_07270 [Chryseobacterium sp. KCF3-3]